MGAAPFLYATMMIPRPGSVGDPWYPELVLPVGRSGSTQGGKNRIDDHGRLLFRGSVCNFVDVRGRQIVPLEAFYNLGDACVAPTQTCPRQDPVLRAGEFHGRRSIPLCDHDDSQAGVRLVILGTRNRVSRLGDQGQPKGEETGSTATEVHSAGRCATLSTFAVDKSFRYRRLQPGRRTRRPYTDMPPTRPVERAGAFHGRRSIPLCDHDDSQAGFRW